MPVTCPPPSCRRTTRIVASLSIVLTFALGSNGVWAATCASPEAQVEAPVSPQLRQLNRQLNAIRGLERQRKCSAGASGFFSACGNLATRRADVERQIAAASKKGGSLFGQNRSALKARRAALGCTTKPARPRIEKAVAVELDHGRRLPTGNAMLFCVRFSDGYYFPTPNSQFVSEKDDYENTLDRCRFICQDQEMDVYALDDPRLETEEMRSVDTGRRYTELASAFAYREAADFRACDLRRYYRRVDEARARSVTPRNLDNAVIPLPIPRPAEALPEVVEALAYGAEPAVPASMNPLTRRVRIVGAPYLPLE